VSLLGVLGAVSLSVAAADGTVPRERIGHDVWGFKEGAPENVISIAQSDDGFLWLGTPSGLFRFDGSRFERFQPSSGDALLSTQVSAVFAPPTGGLWVGYLFGGFSFIRNGKVRNFGNLPSETRSVRVFAQGPDGVVWATCSTGLWRFEDPHWVHPGAEWNVPPGLLFHIGFDRQGVLWTLGDYGPLLFLRPGASRFEIVQEHLEPEAPAKNSWTYDFRIDADRRVMSDPSSRPPWLHDIQDRRDPLPALPLLTKGSVEIVDRRD